ncbi:MAG TPA: hypothetical protein VM529_17600, partial [Gemmata sp.]|nr:hypothetical protein [Gemmata sp.]
MFAGRPSRFLAATVFVGMLVPLAASQDLDPVKQREEQKKIKARIDEAARRLGSTIDAMAYQRLSASAERKMLEGVAGDLRGLSAEQVRDILDRLDSAVANPATASEAQKEAFAKQRQVIEQLRGMFFRLDVIKNLDEAAARLEHQANMQIDVRAATVTNANLPIKPGRRGPVLDDSEALAIEQSDLRAEVEAIVKQVRILATDPEISKILTPEQKDRLAAAEVLPRGDALVADLRKTVADIRARLFTEASGQQLGHAKELKELAAALRTPPGSRVDALKAAAEKLDRAIDAQTKANNDARDPITPEEAQKASRAGLDPKRVKGNELANQQTKAEFATRDARRAAQQAAPEVADILAPAETKQWKAEAELRKGEIDEAKQPQEAALNELKAAKNELDRQIAAAELAKQDPLAAVKQAAERV